MITEMAGIAIKNTIMVNRGMGIIMGNKKKVIRVIVMMRKVMKDMDMVTKTIALKEVENSKKTTA